MMTDDLSDRCIAVDVMGDAGRLPATGPVMPTAAALLVVHACHATRAAIAGKLCGRATPS
jgi:hypothetical protein